MAKRKVDKAPAEKRGAKKKRAAKATPAHWKAGNEPGEPMPEEVTTHLARCADCAAGAKFKLSPTGAGFTVLERYGVDVEATFGIGPNVRPICPHGHGEMMLADEQVLVGDAMQQVADKVNGEASQPQLFDTTKPFNFEGAYRELEDMSVEVDRLAHIYDDDKREAGESRKAWEEASKRRDKAALEFRRRRQEKERKDAQAQDPARDADEKLCFRLNAAGVAFDVASARALTPEQRGEVETWLLDTEAHPDERERWSGALPSALAPVPGEVPDDGLPAAEGEFADDDVALLADDSDDESAQDEAPL